MRIILIGLFLYSIRARQRISEKSYLGSDKGEYYEQNGNHTEYSNCELLFFASGFVFRKLPRFVDICNCGRDEENCDIKPVGRLADSTVVGVEDDGN